MMGLRHPQTGEVYEVDDDDPTLVRVSNEQGQWGRFTKGGSHVDGELRFADPHVCGWVVTKPMSHRYRNVAQHAEH